ncbi:MAG: TonB-dependent receptor domain-containing protein [bacterium]
MAENKVRHLRLFLSTFILFTNITFVANPTSAQQNGEDYAAISGKVIDETNESPLPYVEVFIKTIGRGDVSNTDGQFRINKIPPGSYDVIFRRQGYRTIRRQNVLLTAGSALVLNAEMSETVIEADELVVTATRNAEYEQDIPQLVSVVTQKEIREKNIAQTPELLREEQGVYIQKTNQGGGSALIRGLKANKILLMIDGIRLNNSTYRGGNTQYLNTIGAQSLEKIEVVHGPVSALYGSDALGGAINTMTKSPALSATQKPRWAATASGLVSSADAIASTSLSLSGAGARFGILLDASFHSYGDVRRGASGGETLMERLRNDSREDRVLPEKQAPNAFDAYNLMAKALYKTGESSLTALFQLNRQPSVPRYDVFERQEFSKWHYEPQERDFACLSYKISRPTKLFNFATATLSFQRQFERRIKQRLGRTTESREAYETVTLGAELQLNRIFGEHFFVAYGFEFYTDDVSTESSEQDLVSGSISPITTLYPDGSTYNSFGAFFQGEIVLSRRWILDGGLRFSAFKLKAPFVPGATGSLDLGTVEQSPNAFTGSIGTRFELADNLNLVANFAQGFRAPNLDDVSKLGLGKGGRFYDVPNADLGPEEVLSIDGGFKFGFERFKAHAIAYYSDFTDLLVRRPAVFNGQQFIVDEGDTVSVFRKENTGKAYIAGFELGAKVWLVENFSATGQISYTYGQNTSDDEPLAAMPPMNGFVGLRYDAKQYWLEINSRFATEQDRLAAEDLEDTRIPEGGTPGWWTLNFRVGYSVNNNLALRFALANIFDTNYREHLSGLNAPGRNFILSGEVRL